jgi:hypothetical protein
LDGFTEEQKSLLHSGGRLKSRKEEISYNKYNI